MALNYAPWQVNQKDSSTNNGKKINVQRDEGRKNNGFQEQWSKPEATISKGQISLTGKGKEPLTEEIIDEQLAEVIVLEPIVEEQVIRKEVYMQQSAEETSVKNIQHHSPHSIVIEEYVSPTRSPENLMIEWYSAGHEV